ncbi:MAG: hypothetical protein ACO1TE_06680 [Prosthecobacter sp.]
MTRRHPPLAAVLVCCLAAQGMAQTIAPAPAPAPVAPAAPATPTPTPTPTPAPAPAATTIGPMPSTAPQAKSPPLPTGLLTPPATAAPAGPRLDRLSPLGTRPDWLQLQSFHQTMTRAEFETVMRDVYGDSSPLPPPWKLELDGVVVQTGDPAKPEARIAFASRAQPPQSGTRTWRRVSELPPLKGRPLLSDVHIAIDPGHIGGPWSVMEERYLSFAPNEAIQEGVLTLITAQVLAERLKALGAYVTLVRDRLEPVTPVRPDQLTKEAKQLLAEAGFPEPQETYSGAMGEQKIITVQWQSEKLFYRVSEIHARATKVNEAIKPDMVLCLHYNAEAWGDATAPQFTPLNHMHVLVNGCYSPVELQQQDVRFEMFHRLFSRIHEEELPLAEAVAAGMHSATGLPPYVYTTPNARRMRENPYVYARNLLANRIYNCPVVYLEPFVMNHEETYRRLLNGHFIGRTLIAGRLQTSAIEEYVRGIVQGLVAYYQKNRAS